MEYQFGRENYKHLGTIRIATSIFELTIRIITPKKIKIIDHQYVIRNSLSDAILSSPNKRFRNVANGPDGST